VRRRNADRGDTYIRELERRVLEGDLSLVSRLAAAYDRAGRGLDPLSVSRDMIRAAYWRDVRVVADEVARREGAPELLRAAINEREHVRPHRQQQVSRLQGGWVTMPSWLAEVVARTGRLADSSSMREAIEFSNNAAADRLVNIAAKAELCFLSSVHREAVRQLMGLFPYPLGSRLRTLVPFSEDDGEGEIPDRIIPVGSKGTLVDVHHHERREAEELLDRRPFTPVIITDDYWADWGDVIDAYPYDSVAAFDQEFRVEGSP
jgi:hypothetical protein